HFEKAVTLDGKHAEAHLYLGKSYAALDRWPEAIVSLREALQLTQGEHQEVKSTLFKALLGGGLEEFKKGNYQASIDYLREGLTLRPGSLEAARQLGTTMLAFGSDLLSQGKLADALSAFQEAVLLLPENLEAWLGLAKTYYAENNPVEALQAAMKALNLDTRSQELGALLLAIGQKLLSKGFWDQAITAFKAVLEIVPEKYEAYIGLAEAFLKSGEVQEAIETVKEALKIDPTSQEARELLLRLLRRL
ncbi:tetratricopeptide repeat protein, partial [Thermodesulfobacteriota bacterium]